MVYPLLLSTSAPKTQKNSLPDKSMSRTMRTPILISRSWRSSPPCTIGNRLYSWGFECAAMQRSSHLVVRQVASRNLPGGISWQVRRTASAVEQNALSFGFRHLQEVGLGNIVVRCRQQSGTKGGFHAALGKLSNWSFTAHLSCFKCTKVEGNKQCKL